MTGLSIVLGADSLLGPRSGVGRMTLEIARQLEISPEIAAFGLLIRGRVHGADWLAQLDAAAAPDIRPPAWSGLWMKRMLGDWVPGVTQLHLLRRNWQLRAQMREDRLRLAVASPFPVVYHEPNMITRPFDGPTVPCFNDLSWHHDAALHPKSRIRWIERNLPPTIPDASRFIAISAFTRDEMVRVLGIDAARIDVVHLAPSPAFRPMDATEAAPILARHDLCDQSYVFSISTLEPRKNFDRLLAAYLGLPDALRARVPLVIAGGKGWGSVLARRDADRAVASGQLRLLGHVPDADLVALTARCAAFAYVSLYEGFGLPVVEAMAAGAPVLCARTTATGETAADAALLIDPEDVGAIATGLRQMLDPPGLAPAYRTKSLRRAMEFNWPRTVGLMTGVWRHAAA